MVSTFFKPGAIESRDYQEILAYNVLDKGNSLIVAPTALGKTIVASLIINQRLREFPSQKVLVLSPTKPLAVQHQQTFQKVFDIPVDQIELLTGSLSPKKREEAWQRACIISATPQAIENDIINGRLSLKNFSLVVFDEAHRAVGDYSYVFLASRYIKQANNALILGLTASPGSESEKIQDVCRNLFISNIEIKTLKDADVQDYANPIELEWEKVALSPDFLQIKGWLRDFQNDQLLLLKKLGFVTHLNANFLRRKDLLALQGKIRASLNDRSNATPEMWTAISKLAALLKVSHAETLLETQGIVPLHDYFGRLQEKSGQSGSPKALKTVLEDARIQKAIQATQHLFEKGETHPKQHKLVEILQAQFKQNPQSKVIVFNHYRDSVKHLTGVLEKIPSVVPLRFVGQATKGTDKGLTQKQQKELLEQFRNGDYNVLVASSVAEEGLDIPQVDLVIFFEPVPSEIRTIQRRGRTGRLDKGRCIVLMATKTRDEAYYYSSLAKERSMHSVLKSMQKNPNATLPIKSKIIGINKQTNLSKYVEELKDKVEVFVDSREQASSVVRELSDLGAIIRVKQLEVSDYVLGPEIAVERKTVEDFLESMLDGRLFNQLQSLCQTYSSPLVILEGNPRDLFSLRNIHKNAILGAMSSIALTYRVPILFSENARETAEILFVIAKREQLGKDKDLRIRTGRKGLTLPQSQQFIIESLPLVGPTMAKSLLSHFGSVKSIVSASEKELQAVDNMGEKKAKKIVKLVNAQFNEKEKTPAVSDETEPETSDDFSEYEEPDDTS